MNESYLAKNNQLRQNHHLPHLKLKKPKAYLPTSLNQIAEPDEKALLLQIKDIDSSLHSK